MKNIFIILCSLAMLPTFTYSMDKKEIITMTWPAKDPKIVVAQVKQKLELEQKRWAMANAVLPLSNQADLEKVKTFLDTYNEVPDIQGAKDRLLYLIGGNLGRESEKRERQLAIIEYLLKNGANPHSQKVIPASHRTAYDSAIEWQAVDLLKLLLKYVPPTEKDLATAQTNSLIPLVGQTEETKAHIIYLIQQYLYGSEEPEVDKSKVTFHWQ